MREIPIPMWLQLFLLCASVVGAILTTIKVVKWIQRGVKKANATGEAVINMFNLMMHEYKRNGGDSHKDLLIINNEKLDISSGKQDMLIDLMGQILTKLNAGPVLNIVNTDKESVEPIIHSVLNPLKE